MIYPKPKNEAERKKQHRISYEIEKEDLMMVYKQEGWDSKGLQSFLVNSLKDDYAEELKEDGLI